MSKRVFEHEGRFREVWRDGSSVFTRFGRIGEGGHTKLEDAGSPADADRTLDALVAAWLASGFDEAGGGGSVAAKAPIDGAELDRQIASLPRLVDDPGYLVFADWVQSQGDPWGELVAVQYNVAHPSGKNRAAIEKKRAQLGKAEAELLDKLGAAILGPAARHAQSRFEWHHGFLRTAVLGTAPDPALMLAALQALLVHPAARMLRGVVLHPVPTRFEVHRDWDSSPENIVDPWTDLAALAAAIPKTVTHVGFGGWPAPAASAYVRMPTFTAISEAFPHVRRLELTGSAPDELGTLALPMLTDLELRFAEASHGALTAIRESALDKLERLSVWLGGNSHCVLDDLYAYEDGGYPDSHDGNDLEQLEVHGVNGSVSAAELGELIEAMPPTLKHLGIQSAMITAEDLEAVIAHPRIAKLHTLDLSGGTLDDAAAKVLIAAKKQLARIAVNVERNRIGAATAKKLAAALPKASVANQRKEAEPELFMRYVATME